MIPAIYDTTITHTRIEPTRHTFRYRSQSWLVDVDDLPELPRWSRMLIGFRPADHLETPRSGADTLRARVDQTLREAGVRPRPGQVTALLNARCFGYVFDPLTLFWCHDPKGDLYAAIAEVHNTYGGRHAYVLALDDRGAATMPKVFYVSPFNAADDGCYRMRIPEPAQDLRLSVILEVDGRPRLVATSRGRRRPATSANIIRSQLRAPFTPLTVMAHIRFQGIRLWLKGLPVIPRTSTTTRSLDGPDTAIAAYSEGQHDVKQ